MTRFSERDEFFICPYCDGCPYLEGLSTRQVWDRYQESHGLECHYEAVIQDLDQELDQARQRLRDQEREIAHLKAQLAALHRRQFKGRTKPREGKEEEGAPAGKKKKRGAPVGHPPWRRAKPRRIDRIVAVPAPETCPRCGGGGLEPCGQPHHEHVQEDIVLEPRTETTCFCHQTAWCACCGRSVWQPGPGELAGAYIGPAAKATALYLRREFHASERKISRFFEDFFGLRFVPASAWGFERQGARRGAPLYEDLLEKARALPVAHADETSWRHDGQSYWVWYVGNGRIACFHWDAHRTAEVAQSLLGERFGGVLVADGLASYKSVHPKDWQSCLAHVKTRAKELGQELAQLTGKADDRPARQFCQSVQGWVREACQEHARLSRKPWRAKAARQSARALDRKLRALCRTPLRYPRAEKFRQRLLGPEQKHFFACFRHRGVPPTNSQAERSLRTVVILRKVIQGTRSDKALQTHSILQSLFETARRQGRKAHAFFLDLFTKTTEEAQAALYRNTCKADMKKARPP